MQTNSIIYGCIVFLALIFGDLIFQGAAAMAGPLAALLLTMDATIFQKRSKGEPPRPPASRAGCRRSTNTLPTESCGILAPLACA